MLKSISKVRLGNNLSLHRNNPSNMSVTSYVEDNEKGLGKGSPATLSRVNLSFLEEAGPAIMHKKGKSHFRNRSDDQAGGLPFVKQSVAQSQAVPQNITGSFFST